MNLEDLTEEHYRILRAADAGRLCMNDSGRYVIGGEAKRPESKPRTALIHGGLIEWPRPQRDGGRCNITAEGRAALAEVTS